MNYRSRTSSPFLKPDTNPVHCLEIIIKAPSITMSQFQVVLPTITFLLLQFQLHKKCQHEYKLYKYTCLKLGEKLNRTINVIVSRRIAVNWDFKYIYIYKIFSMGINKYNISVTTLNLQVWTGGSKKYRLQRQTDDLKWKQRWNTRWQTPGSTSADSPNTVTCFIFALSNFRRFLSDNLYVPWANVVSMCNKIYQ